MWHHSVATENIRLGQVLMDPESITTASCSPVSPFLQFVVTEPSQMKSIRMEGCHVGNFLEFVCTACWSYKQSNTTSNFIYPGVKTKYHSISITSDTLVSGVKTKYHSILITSDTLVSGVKTKYHSISTSNGSWRQGIKGEMTCTGYVALVWNIIYRIMTIIVIMIVIIIIIIMIMIIITIMIIIMIIIIITIIMIIIIMIIMIIITMIIIIIITIIIKRWLWWW